MLDVTNKVWEMLLDEAPNEDILKICSVSSLCKIRAEFNKQKKEGKLRSKPGKFPQKPRGKNAVEETGIKEGGHFGRDKDGKLNGPPPNYPRPGKPEITTEENFEKGEKSFLIKSYEINTLEDLIKWTKIDMTQFDCASFTANRWGNGRWECTQCKATFKPKVKNGITPEEAAEVFYNLVENYCPPTHVFNNMAGLSNSGNIAESVAMDVHFGSLTRKEETGIDYNLDIAENDLIESTKFHLSFIETFEPEKIIMPIGSDFFNVDTVDNTTTKGTPQSEDSTWKHTFEAGCTLMITCIDLHKQIAPVKVMVIIGNHDTQRSFALGAFLTAWYRNDPLVTIDNSPTIRKYFSWGTTLIGISHGEEKRGTNYLGLMNIEARKQCGKAIYKEFHLGHKHHLDIKEDLGFRVRGLGGLTATDGWHSKMGYGALRESQAFIINKSSGIIAQSSFHPINVI
jgi:hypothetical protein